VAPSTTSNAVAYYRTLPATITLTPTDNAGGSGVAYTHYKLDGGAETSGTTITTSVLGTRTIEFWSVDRSGNAETPHKTVSFMVDNVGPTTTRTSGIAGGRYANPITLSATDNAGGSGVAATYYTVDGGAQQQGTSIAFPTTGRHTIVFWSVDRAGNVGTTTTLTNIRSQ
jgi:hypothetical protein